MRMEDAPRPTVLIAGSSGFLGQAIAKGLKGRYQVIGLDVAKPKSTKPENRNDRDRPDVPTGSR
jgi:nucleoside-diphosphate-sugar epimerase